MKDDAEVKITAGDLRRAAAECPDAKRILERLCPEAFEEPHRFKVGDRVVVLVDERGLKGKAGTVMGYSPAEKVGVEMDSPFSGGHDLFGALPCRTGRGHFFTEKSLEKEAPWEDVTSAWDFTAALLNGGTYLSAVGDYRYRTAWSRDKQKYRIERQRVREEK